MRFYGVKTIKPLTPLQARTYTLKQQKERATNALMKLVLMHISSIWIFY